MYILDIDMEYNFIKRGATLILERQVHGGHVVLI